MYGRFYKIKYEGLHLLCLTCGKFVTIMRVVQIEGKMTLGMERRKMHNLIQRKGTLLNNPLLKDLGQVLKSQGELGNMLKRKKMSQLMGTSVTWGVGIIPYKTMRKQLLRKSMKEKNELMMCIMLKPPTRMRSISMVGAHMEKRRSHLADQKTKEGQGEK